MPQAFGIENKALDNVVRANVKSTFRIFSLELFLLAPTKKEDIEKKSRKKSRKKKQKKKAEKKSRKTSPRFSRSSLVPIARG